VSDTQPPSNATEADLLAELRRLTLAKLIAAVQGENPKASLLAVAARVLAENKVKLTPPMAPLGRVPFPSTPLGDATPAPEAAPSRSAELQELLAKVPFKAVPPKASE
jgi:hypothetical protein